MSGSPDPLGARDGRPDSPPCIEALETRGRARPQRRLRRRFLRFVPVRPGDDVLEVGCGTGVIVRDLATMIGARGRVVGIDRSPAIVSAARLLARPHPHRSRMVLKVADGARLPFRAGRFDVALAITVMLHAPDPLTVVKEMARVVRPGGLVGLQDQDFGTMVVPHPDRRLTAKILDEVVERVYPEPHSGRYLPGVLRDAGLDAVRVLTEVYQDTTLEPYTRTFLERRAEQAVQFGIVSASTARRWLDGLTELVAGGVFLFTLNYYGAVGERR